MNNRALLDRRGKHDRRVLDLLHPSIQKDRRRMQERRNAGFQNAGIDHAENQSAVLPQRSIAFKFCR